MPDKFSLLPFMMGTLAVVPGAKVNVSRLIEAFIIAAVTGSISLYGVTKVLETKLDQFEKRLVTVEQQEHNGREEMRSDLKELRVFIQDHVLRGK